MTEAYLLLGSNQGDRQKNIQAALSKISASVGAVRKQSGLYQTAAWGNEDQPDFLNQAILVQTKLLPLDLLRLLKQIEKDTGRVHTEKWGPRVIDADILFYGNENLDLPELVIPHPYIAQRRFTLQPLSEIAPDFIHPVLKKTVAQLLTECPDRLDTRLLIDR